MMLKVNRISKNGVRGEILKDIDFFQKPLQKIAIAGETGSGKSTLLKIIAGLVQADAGEVILEDEKIKGPDETLVAGHADIAYLSQHFELPKFLRVEQVLAYANTISVEEATAIYEVCQIDHLLSRKTDQLSGGERQRIALARVLIAWPKLLLLDEPFSNLDLIHRATLKTVIRDVSDQLGITCTLVSHEPADLLSWADEIIVIRHGNIVQRGTPIDIYRKPKNLYVAGLFGKYNILNLVEDSSYGKLFKKLEKDKKLIVRPEDFEINNNPNDGFLGKVREVHFYGSHDECHVALSNKIIIVKAESGEFSPGDKIYLSITPNKGWYI